VSQPPDHAGATSAANNALLGLACGVGAALFWAAGMVAAKHGISVGMSASDLSFHRFVWAGIVLLPFIARAGLRDLGGIGWGRGLVLTLFGGPLQAALSYSGFLLVPLAHGGVIQPSTAALSGILLSALVIKEKLPWERALGAIAIVAGLCVIGSEALTTIGAHGVLGDLSFVAAGFTFALFAMCLRLWHIAPTYAVGVVSVLSLGYIPVHALVFGFDTMLAAGWYENLIQIVVQGFLIGIGATYFFARAVVLLGAGRAAVFPSLVPPLTLLVGFLAIGDVPTLVQLAGLAIVLIGFRLTQKA
jgi:drug/metabolite transporter (DMT)-like permease